MELFREWIVTIISIIIFVTFIEILLPNSNHRRYISVIIGLLIMFVILKPLLGFVKDGASLGEGILAASNQMEQQTLQNRVQQQQFSNNDMVLELYKQELKKQMSGRLEKQLGVLVHDIELDIEDKDQESFGSIKGIYIVLREDEDTVNNSSSGIQEINVNVTISSKNNNNIADESIMIGSRGEAIIDDFSSFYQVSRDNISVAILKSKN